MRVSHFIAIGMLLSACAAHRADRFPADAVFLEVGESPDVFDGKVVTIKAWLTLRFEDRNLWATRKDHEEWKTSRCLSLVNYDSLAGMEKTLDDQYIEIIGTVRSDASKSGTIVRSGHAERWL